MSAADLAMPIPARAGVGPDRWSRWIVLAFVCSLCATLWAFTRIPMAGSLHAWAAKQCVLLEMQPEDWPCRLSMGRSLVLYLTASALVSLAVLVPTLILALRGRRLLAFVPIVGPLAITLLSNVATWAWSGFWAPLEHTSTSQLFLGPYAPWSASEPVGSVWRPDHPLAIGADLVLLGVPVLALMALVRPERAGRVGFSARSAVLALGLAAGASVIVEWASHALTGAAVYLEGGWFVQGLAMVSFGLLLPTGSGRPLWTIPLVACLLSLGGPAAVAGSLYDDGLTTFTFFRSAVPLALMGFAGVAAVAFVARQRGLLGETPTGPRTGAGRRPLAYGISFGTLAVVTVMAALDPLPYAISAPLPTYLGARERVDDLRSRMTLDEALDVASGYRSVHGSFRGFDAAAARDEESRLLWADGLPPVDATLVPELTVRILPERDRLRLVLVGDVTTYCVRAAEAGIVTYGVADRGTPRERALTALGACGDRRWTAALLRPFPIEGLCLDDASVLLCRGTQRLLRGILASPTGLA